MIKLFFIELSVENQTNQQKFFGIYIDKNIPQQTRVNINRLALSLWKAISKEQRYCFGNRYTTYAANGDCDRRDLVNNFLEIVEGLSYLPDNIKTPIIKHSLENLITTHNSRNDFYNMPSFVSQLKAVIGVHGSVPPQMNFRYVKTIVTAFLTNGCGISNLAEPIYID